MAIECYGLVREAVSAARSRPLLTTRALEAPATQTIESTSQLCGIAQSDKGCLSQTALAMIFKLAQARRRVGIVCAATTSCEGHLRVEQRNEV